MCIHDDIVVVCCMKLLVISEEQERDVLDGIPNQSGMETALFGLRASLERGTSIKLAYTLSQNINTLSPPSLQTPRTL